MSDYLKAIRVLIVDERDFVRLLVRQILNALDCKNIEEACNGEEAWEMALVRKPDIVITCWEMAPTNGLDLTRRLRSHPDTPNPFMPVIMMTSHAEFGRVVEARDAGISEYVIKPLSAKSLFGRIHAVIEHPLEFVRTKSYFGPDRRRKAWPVAKDRRLNKSKADQNASEEAALDQPQAASL